MIRPRHLFGLFQECEDDLWLGRICRALGGQDVELDYGQQQMVNLLKNADETEESQAPELVGILDTPGECSQQCSESEVFG